MWADPLFGTGRKPRRQEARVECVAGTGRVGHREMVRGNLEPKRLSVLDREDARAARPALDDRDRGKLEQAPDGRSPDDAEGLGGGGEQDVGRDVANELDAQPRDRRRGAVRTTPGRG